MEVQLHSFLASALDEPVWSISRSSRFIFGGQPRGAHSKGVGEGDRNGHFEGIKKLLPQQESNDFCTLFT